jgi:hypothetical protein
LSLQVATIEYFVKNADFGSVFFSPCTEAWGQVILRCLKYFKHLKKQAAESEKERKTG